MPLWIRTGEAVGRVGGILVPGCFHVSVCPWPRCEAISPTCLPSWDPDLIVISLSTDSRRLPLILHISACLAFFLTHFISHISFPLYIYFLTSPPPFLPFLIYLCLSFLPGSLTVSAENPPPVLDPSFHSLSSSSASSPAFPPPSFDRWSPDRTRPRGSAPNRNARIPPRTDLPPDTQLPFVWKRGTLTECSATCGRGR